MYTILIQTVSVNNQCTKALASFPGPAQLSVAFSTASDGKLGGAWERGYKGTLDAQSEHISANTRPHQLRWSEWERGTHDSC